MSSGQSGEGEIRKNLIEADLVDCIVALPGQLFRSTQIPACLWFLSRGRRNGSHRDRANEVLFVDARKLGHMADRTHRDLSPEDIARVADTYHAWRGHAAGPPLPLGEGQGEGYADVPGFCKSATLEEVRRHGHVLTPGRYVGAEPQSDDGEPFAEKMARLTAQWRGSRPRLPGWTRPSRRTWRSWGLVRTRRTRDDPCRLGEAMTQLARSDEVMAARISHYQRIIASPRTPGGKAAPLSMPWRSTAP